MLVTLLQVTPPHVNPRLPMISRPRGRAFPSRCVEGYKCFCRAVDRLKTLMERGSTMKMSRLAVALAALVGMFAPAAPAYADVTVAQAFAADSGDSCRYGVTEGTLTWRFLPSPTPPAF